MDFFKQQAIVKRESARKPTPLFYYQRLKRNSYLPCSTTACAAANLAIGTLNGEQLT